MNGENELPESWTEVTLLELTGGRADSIVGGPFGSNLQVKDYQSSGIPIIRLQNIDYFHFIHKDIKYISEKKATELKYHSFRKGDLVLAKLGTPIGKTCQIPEDFDWGIVTADVVRIRLRDNEVIKNYLLYYLNSPRAIAQLNDQIFGSTRPRVNLKEVRGTIVPLPPLAEQRRIVAAVEALLARVNASRERLDRVSVMLKAFRQAVLAAACSGRLTEGWRNSTFDSPLSDSLPHEWKAVKIDEISDSRLGKMLDKAKNRGDLTPYLRNTNVRWFDFDLFDIKTIRATESDRAELTLMSGDILVCEGGEPGRCAIWRDTGENYLFQKALHRIRVHENILPKWICYNLKDAADSGRLSDLFTGSTIKHLTGVSLREFKFLLPPITEQHEIVRRVESLFAFADHIEQRVAVGKERADRLTQAILSKAFRGELVPTEAELARREGRRYEPASMLLERIKKEKIGKSTRK